mgnify:CR=1 FL=1
MTAHQPLRLALIGCGNIATAHIRAFQTLGPEVVRVVATCDVSAPLAEARARDLGADHALTDFRAVLEMPTVEAVDLCLPHYLHAEIAIAAAQAGKHILVEKPMACSLAEAHEMVSAAEKAGVILMVGQMQRYHPLHRGVKRLIAAGELGTIRGVRFDAMQNLLGYAQPGHWLYDGRLAGGGILISVSVHKIDLMRYFLGEVRRVAAICRTAQPHFRNGAEDYACAVLEFQNGAIGEHFATYSGFQLPYSESYMLFGDEGTVHTLPTGQAAYYASRRHDPTPPDLTGARRFYGHFLPVAPDRTGLPTDDPFVNEIAHFVDCCRTGTEPLSSGRDNLGTMAVIAALYASARQGGQPVEVTL